MVRYRATHEQTSNGKRQTISARSPLRHFSET
ncbi:hypothetical protein FAES_1692 [Fibrella aestuarina BUZ 2]|uniref:Uncharacterized protein n=1 Tax=Fibrella aestuarina BUZ 2 TaxID=1166018 RepID=I0K6E9_9BACT|nr:hypothetical protein FAES_1692 [Fibrella aestuarina BUZ 2]